MQRERVTMRQIERYLQLPWTIELERHTDDGDYIALRVAELPGFIVADRTVEGAEHVFWPALRDFLNSYLEAGETPPTPEGFRITAPQSEPPPTRFRATPDEVKNHEISETHGAEAQLISQPA